MANVTALDVNDLLRLAVQDQRFAGAMISEPGRFKKAFNLSATSLTAITEAMAFTNPVMFQLDDCSCDEGFDYE